MLKFENRIELETVDTKFNKYVLLAYTDNENKYSVHQIINRKNEQGYTEKFYEFGYYSNFENCVIELIENKYKELEQNIYYYTDKTRLREKHVFFILRQNKNGKYLMLEHDFHSLYLDKDFYIYDKVIDIIDFTDTVEVEEFKDRIEYLKNRDIKTILNKYNK